MSYTLKEIQQLLEDSLQQEEIIREPRRLYEPIEYTMATGGKRLRPSLLLLACNLYKKDVMHAMPAALGIEFFHNFTLLHDDIMDRADTRRNQPTVHAKWNDNVAILSGDAMFIKAYAYLLKTQTPNYRELLEVFNSTALEVCEGQQYDMDFEDREDVSEHEYLEMIRLKTAVLLAAALKMGALAGEAPAADAEKLYSFGLNLGLGFQLQDDYLDVFGDPKVFGKKIGGDICANKKTYLLIKALELAEGDDREELKSWLEKKEFIPEEKIKAVKTLYHKLHIADITKTTIYEYHRKAMDALSQLELEKEAVKELEVLAQKLIDRSS